MAWTNDGKPRIIRVAEPWAVRNLKVYRCRQYSYCFSPLRSWRRYKDRQIRTGCYESVVNASALPVGLASTTAASLGNWCSLFPFQSMLSYCSNTHRLFAILGRATSFNATDFRSAGTGMVFYQRQVPYPDNPACCMAALTEVHRRPIPIHRRAARHQFTVHIKPKNAIVRPFTDLTAGRSHFSKPPSTDASWLVFQPVTYVP